MTSPSSVTTALSSVTRRDNGALIQEDTAERLNRKTTDRIAMIKGLLEGDVCDDGESKCMI